MTFTDLLLPPDLIAALAKQQISDPTPIQSAAIPVLLAGKDAYLNAETGTGKTLAYLAAAVRAHRSCAGRDSGRDRCARRTSWPSRFTVNPATSRRTRSARSARCC